MRRSLPRSRRWLLIVDSWSGEAATFSPDERAGHWRHRAGAQGTGAQGLASQGLARRAWRAGLGAQGLARRAWRAGMRAGLGAQGSARRALSAQGMASQGRESGRLPHGVRPSGVDPKGVSIARIVMHGTLSTDTSTPPTQLTGLPAMSTGTGNYISVAGARGRALREREDARCEQRPAARHGEPRLYIAGEMRDPVPNLFHNPAEQDNEDELYVVYMFNKFSGQWGSLCPYDPRTQVPPRWRSPRIRRIRPSSSSPARRRVWPRSARATGATAPGPAPSAGSGTRRGTTARRRRAIGSSAPSRCAPTTRPARSLRARPIARTTRASPRTAPSSTSSTPASSSGRTRSRARSARQCRDRGG